MEALDHWRLCDELSVVQAALLIVGEDPSQLQHKIENYPPSNRPPGYDATKVALINAIKGKRLPATVIDIVFDPLDPDGNFVGTCWHSTTVVVEDLRTWLRSQGVETGFFFSQPNAGPDYLSNEHPNYSAKLAAAIQAWRAISADPELRRGRSVKQALIIWLRQHANEFGLTKEDGNPNEQGIEDVAKIANWDTKGGAPKTPSQE
jgi:hypothetical protein